MIPVKEFWTNGTPNHEELVAASEMAMKEDCVVRLKWFVQYDGWYERYVFWNTNIEEMENDLKNIVYGL